MVFGEGFLVLERSVLVQFQCLGPQKKAYLVNYRMQAIFRVLKFQNWDPEGSGGLTELKKTSQTCFWPNVCVIKETFKNLLPLGEKSIDGAQKRGSPSLIWGQIHSKTWAYLPPMII